MIRRVIVVAMVQALAGAMVFLGAGPANVFAQKPAEAINLTGKWQMTLEMEVGNASPVLMFKQDGEKLTGTYTGRYGEYQLIGKVDGRKLEFLVTINAEGTETRMNFTGELQAAGDLIKGNAELGGMGQATWLAKREKK